MQAYFPTPEVIVNTSWYPDSGASNHVTADAENLMEKADYYGTERVHIGNGMGNHYKYWTICFPFTL